MTPESPRDDELPTPRQLRRATVFAVLLALAIALIVVLPAEYGVDPTGLGRRIGLKQMGLLKQELAREAIEDARARSVSPPDTSRRNQ